MKKEWQAEFTLAVTVEADTEEEARQKAIEVAKMVRDDTSAYYGADYGGQATVDLDILTIDTVESLG